MVNDDSDPKYCVPDDDNDDDDNNDDDGRRGLVYYIYTKYSAA